MFIHITKEDFNNSKNEIKDLIKANKNLEDLSETTLFALKLLVDKELDSRGSRLATRGLNIRYRHLLEE